MKNREKVNWKVVFVRVEERRGCERDALAGPSVSDQ